MKKIFIAILGVLLMSVPMVTLAWTPMGAADKILLKDSFSKVGDNDVLEFDSMKAAAGDIVGTDAFNRGVFAASADWQIHKGRGEVETDGFLSVKVKGLVQASDLTNPESAFGAVVSCLDDSGAVTNIATAATYAADSSGFAEFSETLSGFPTTCLEPMVFVTGSDGSFLAYADSTMSAEKNHKTKAGFMEEFRKDKAGNMHK